METVPRRSRLVLAHAVAALALVLNVVPAHAQLFSGVPAWSSVGATGVADESSTSTVLFDNTGGVAIKSTAPAGSVVVVRYPVGPLPSQYYSVAANSFFSLDHLRLSMTFRKPDDASYASATLKRVRLSDGVVSSVVSVNTFEYFPATTVQQSERVFSCTDDLGCVNTYEYAYFVEVVLWKAGSANDPRVVGLRLYTSSS